MPKKNNVSIEDLRRVVEVVKQSSATLAAKKLKVTNPVITNAIQAVEQLANQPPINKGDALENPLFTRGETLKPTQKGIVFREDAQEVERCFNKMVLNMRRPESAREGRVKMHISDLLMATVAIPAISELAARSDYKVAITISITPATEALEALANYDTNLIATLSTHHQNSPSIPGLEPLEEIDSPLVVLAKEDFTLAGTNKLLKNEEEICLSDLVDTRTPLALPPESYKLREVVDRLLGPDKRVQPTLVVNSISHLRLYARTGRAATILPEITVEMEGADVGLIMRPLKDAEQFHTSFSIYKRVNENLDPATQLLADVLSRHLVEFNNRVRARREETASKRASKQTVRPRRS